MGLANGALPDRASEPVDIGIMPEIRKARFTDSEPAKLSIGDFFSTMIAVDARTPKVTSH
ncbi:hypothetical protein E5D57_012825 [Metarhizium anisopliae]|nr:hypothetical protein E5D57_012825 [Metarhizium anisopliae]